MESGTAVEKKPTERMPWGRTQVDAPPCNLEDVMSEELAKELQLEEKRENVLEMDSSSSKFVPGLEDTADGRSDFLLAQMLQHEFDQEHDTMLKKEETKFNGQSKVHPALSDDVDDSSDEDDSLTQEKSPAQPSFNRSGIKGKGKNMTTKHDLVICGRKNASKVMDNFPLQIDTGDGDSFDMKLSNRVFNKLKSHSVGDAKRSQRLTEKKEHSTAEHAVDPKTRLIMYKLINAEVLDHINGVISTGKESVVFHAIGGRLPDRAVPAECAIKVFKTTLNEFKNREKYYRGDFRFADEFKKQNPRKVIKIWAEKEMMNLRRMRKFGIPCPEVVIHKKHILVMSFIGQDQVPALKLKEARLSPEQMQNAYVQCVKAMKTLHKECLLVHADLSEYNMLWHNNQIWFIDVSQSVDFTHPKALEFLLRDCHNVSLFFTKQGVSDVLSQCELFNEITSLDLIGEGDDFLSQVQEYEKQDIFIAHDENRKEYAFDYFFNKTATERETVACADNDPEPISRSRPGS